jgi:transcriptional regulator with XRE-family HTH domain
MKNFRKPFPTRFRALLENKDDVSPLKREVTQTELAKAFVENGTPVTRQTISLYANGGTSPDIEKFKFIADFFNVSYDYLLGESESVKREYIDFAKKTGLSDEAISLLSSYQLKANAILEKSSDQYRFDLVPKQVANTYLEIINTLLTEALFDKYAFSISNYSANTGCYNYLTKKIKSDTLTKDDLTAKRRFGISVFNYDGMGFPLDDDVKTAIVSSIERDNSYRKWNLSKLQEDIALAISEHIIEFIEEME